MICAQCSLVGTRVGASKWHPGTVERHPAEYTLTIQDPSGRILSRSHLCHSHKLVAVTALAAKFWPAIRPAENKQQRKLFEAPAVPDPSDETCPFAKPGRDTYRGRDGNWIHVDEFLQSDQAAVAAGEGGSCD